MTELFSRLLLMTLKLVLSLSVLIRVALSGLGFAIGQNSIEGVELYRY